MANRWQFAQKVSLSDKPNLQKLVQFYVWETPVPDTSQKGISFERLGWETGAINTLHAQMRERTGFPVSSRWITCSAAEIQSKLTELDRLKSYDCSFEFAIHTQKHGLSKTKALFYFIRNSFAHGGFRISKFNGETYYALENRQDGSLKGRAILKESTLLAWIKIVRAGYSRNEEERP